MKENFRLFGTSFLHSSSSLCHDIFVLCNAVGASFFPLPLRKHRAHHIPAARPLPLPPFVVCVHTYTHSSSFRLRCDHGNLRASRFLLLLLPPPSSPPPVEGGGRERRSKPRCNNDPLRPRIRVWNYMETGKWDDAQNGARARKKKRSGVFWRVQGLSSSLMCAISYALVLSCKESRHRGWVQETKGGAFTIFYSKMKECPFFLIRSLGKSHLGWPVSDHGPAAPVFTAYAMKSAAAGQ